MIPFDLDQAEWGSRTQYPDGAKLPWLVDKWVIHYGGGANTAGDARDDLTLQIAVEKAMLKSWQNDHMDNPDKLWQDIAYCYAIGQSGMRFRLRGENRAGATRGDYESDGIPENHEARAVVFILGGDQVPSDAALEAFKTMWLADPLPVIGHRFVFEEGTGGTNTECPGDFLADWIKNERYKESLTMAEYRTVKNVGDWEHGTYDWAIDEARLVIVNDEWADDARRLLDDGRYMAFTRRYHRNLVAPVHEALWSEVTSLAAADAAMDKRIAALERGAAAGPSGGLKLGDVVKLEAPDA